MTNEEKDLLLKDLSARLIHKVKAAYYDSEEGRESVDTIDGIDITSEPEILIGQYGLRIEGIKPYLRPMSSMTEEEQKKFDNFCVIDEDAWRGNGIKGYINQAEIMSKGIDYLNAHHFDYRGLIEKGLVLEAPEGMYDF